MGIFTQERVRGQRSEIRDQGKSKNQKLKLTFKMSKRLVTALMAPETVHDND